MDHLLSDVTDVTLARWLASARAVRRDAGELIKAAKPAPGSREAAYAAAVEALLEQLLSEDQVDNSGPSSGGES